MEKIKSANGRSVSGDDFFNRTKELAILQSRAKEGNHILLSGQCCMGKSSIARELGLRLKTKG